MSNNTLLQFRRLKINTTLLVCALVLLVTCKWQNQKPTENNPDKSISISIGDTVSGLGKNIGCILQDKNNVYWFASNGEGVYRYDGKTMARFTDKDGLCSNFVWTIQEDINGNLWFATRDGICRFNGVSFTNLTDKIKTAPKGKLSYSKGGLFFGHSSGVCFYDGKTFTNFFINPASHWPSPNDMNRSYGIYSTLVDKAGNVWFGTQEKGACRYDGISFTFFTDQGLDKAAVRTLFQDRAGNIWAGNNGAGLFRFNGRVFTNFTDENGLANPDFIKNLKGKEGTLARPWTMNEDDNGNLWIGTIDAGVWKYDGNSLTNYTTKHGLAGNSIWTIYKDKIGEILFVTDGETICKFNGKSFTRFAF